MGQLAYTEYLYRTSVERVKRAAGHKELTATLMERARVAVERSHRQVRQGATEAEIWGRESSSVIESAADGGPDLMEVVSGREFEGELVRLDGKHFVDCTLRECTLEYSGYPVVLETTQFFGCRFQFGGQAAMTMRMLQCFGIMGDGASELIGEAAASASSQGSQRPN